MGQIGRRTFLFCRRDAGPLMTATRTVVTAIAAVAALLALAVAVLFGLFFSS